MLSPIYDSAKIHELKIYTVGSQFGVSLCVASSIEDATEIFTINRCCAKDAVITEHKIASGFICAPQGFCSRFGVYGKPKEDKKND